MFILIILHNLVLALNEKKNSRNLFDIFFSLMPENPPKNINKKKEKKVE